MTPNTAWAAGFLDGLAKISVLTKKIESPSIVCVLEDRVPLARLELLFGGSLTNIRVHNKGKPKTMFRWNIRGAQAMRMLVEVLPGLHLQNERARAALYYSWYDTPSPGFWRRLFTRKRRY